jgi:hypothetical protein
VTVTANVRPAAVVVAVVVLEPAVGDVVDDAAEKLGLDVAGGVVAEGVGVSAEHPASVRTVAATPTVATEARRRIRPSSLPVAAGPPTLPS